MSQRTVRFVVAAYAFAGALWIVHLTPATRAFDGTTCGQVSAWASNQDSRCNEPLLDLFVVASALVAVALLLLLEEALAARVDGRLSLTRVRATSMAVVGACPLIALAWVDTITDGTTWPSVGVALGALAAVVGTLSLLRIAASSDGVVQLAVALVALAGAAGLFAYAQVLWGGNGA